MQKMAPIAGDDGAGCLGAEMMDREAKALVAIMPEIFKR